jgi:glutamate carboxypeptidase
MPYTIDTQLITRFRNRLEQDQPLCLDLLRQMVEINSFTANPAGVNKLGELTAAAFAPLGFTTETVQATNPAYGRHLVLTRPGRSGRKIGLISHLDTVFPSDEEIRNNFSWRPDGDKIYGPGTQDIKGGTVLIYMMLTSLQAVLPAVFDEVTWVVLLNSCEEVAALDFGDVCLHHLEGPTLAGLVFEAGDMKPDRCLTVVGRKGMAVYHITVKGRGAHAGSAHHKGANAILQMARLIEEVAALTDYDRGLTFNVGTMAGGTVINRVPHHAVATGEMRAFASEVYQAGLAGLKSLANRASVRSPADDYPCRIDIDIFHESPPWSRNEASDRLLALWQQAGHSVGLQVLPEERGGLSDGNLIWSQIPTLDGLGPSGRNAHCSEQSADGSKEQEYVQVSSFVPKGLLNLIGILNLINTV